MARDDTGSSLADPGDAAAASRGARGVGAGLARPSRLVAAALLGAALVAFGGCATRLETTVTTFHEPDRPWRGQRFAIVPDDRQKASLEFTAYADLVSRAMQAQGMQPAAGGKADVDVRLNYALIEERPVRYSSPTVTYSAVVPAWGWGPPYRAYPYPYGPGFGYYGYAPYWPGAGYAWGATEVREYPSWRAELRVTMTAPGVERPVYQATSFTDGQDASLASVMPALVESIFHDFPGPNGQTRQVEIELKPPTTTGASAAGQPRSSGRQVPSN